MRDPAPDLPDRRRTLAALLVLSLLAPAAGAQTPDEGGPPGFDPTVVHGLVERDGALLGAVGHRWKAVFGERSLAITPALGPDAPVSRPLVLSLKGVRVGSRALTLDLLAAPVRAGETRAEVRRSATVVERYDARPDGLEVSFVFDELPDVPGDLVVRYAVDTTLAAPEADGDGLAFRADVGGLRVGGVLGIDADGNTAAGELRYDAPWLELVLPEAFVRDAALPLVLDPVIGPIFGIGTGTFVQREPDIAGSHFHQEYLVAYSEVYSYTESEIILVELDENGSWQAGPYYPTFPSSTANEKPTVGYSPYQERFVVAWEHWEYAGFYIWREIQAVTCRAGSTYPGMTAVQTLVDSAWCFDPDLASLEYAGSVYLVWHKLCQGIWARGFAPDSNGYLQPFTAEVPVGPPGCADGDPKVSRFSTGGGFATALVTWQRNDDLRMTLIDFDLGIQVYDQPLVTTAAHAEPTVDVAADGATYLTVFHRINSAGAHKIKRRHVTWDGSSLSTPVEGNVYSSPSKLWDVSVVHAGDVYLVAFTEGGDDPSTRRAKVCALDQTTFQRLGPPVQLGNVPAESVALATLDIFDPLPTEPSTGLVVTGGSDVYGATVSEGP